LIGHRITRIWNSTAQIGQRKRWPIA